MSDRSSDELGPRELAVLRSIIRAHILRAEPVGSLTISRGAQLDLSPATIRNVMVDLEARGLLSQPHASAGRVPTARAYRIYVDRIITRPRLDATRARAIDRALINSRGEIAEFLTEASRQLSRFSHHVGVVLAPEVESLVVERVEFVKIDGRRVVAILVGRSGVVNNRILDLAEPLEQDELDRIGRFLSAEFAGRTLPEIRAELGRRAKDDQETYDRIVARGLELGRQTLEFEGREGNLFVEGTSNLLEAPEFADPERIRALVRALGEKQTLIDLLGRVLESRGVQVVIGDENPGEALAHCSLVAASYGSSDRMMGTVAIVGPTRMEYARAIALVDYLGRLLSEFFSGSGELTRKSGGPTLGG